MTKGVFLATGYRHFQAEDEKVLLAELPALLGGNWTAEGLQAAVSLQHQLRVLVDIDSQELVAFAEFQNIADENQLFNLAVMPHWQRRGCGSALLRAVLAEARSNKLQQSVLEVRESNFAARQLYEKLGYKLVTRRKDYYPSLAGNSGREAAIIYLLTL